MHIEIRISHILPLLLLALLSCEKDAESLTPAPPLLGIGDNNGRIPITGDTVAVGVFWTRATETRQTLAFELEGKGSSEDDLLVLTPSPVEIPAGATETTILLRSVSEVDPDRVEREGTLRLLPGDWYRLTERDTFNFNFGVPHTVDVERWAPQITFPQLFGYTSRDARPVPPGDGLDAGPHFVFAHASNTEPNVIGFYNEQPNNSTNIFNLHRIYAPYDVLSSSADLRAPALLRFTPDGPAAERGRVTVIEQRLTVNRRRSSPLPPSFTVGISGGGTYDEAAGIISLDVYFDESELGIAEPVLRRYSYEVNER